MKVLMSNWVGQDFWQGASAHLRHLAASRSAPLSLRVVCLMSSKLLFKVGHEEQPLSSFLFQCFLITFVRADGTRDACVLIRGFNESKFYQSVKLETGRLETSWRTHLNFGRIASYNSCHDSFTTDLKIERKVSEKIDEVCHSWWNGVTYTCLLTHSKR